VPSFLKLQTGDYLLLQTGDKLLLQDQSEAGAQGGGAGPTKPRRSRAQLIKDDDEEVMRLVEEFLRRIG
jgi:hypothetical protein